MHTLSSSRSALRHSPVYSFLHPSHITSATAGHERMRLILCDQNLVPDDRCFLLVLSVSGRDRPNSVVLTRHCCTFGNPVQGPGAGVNKLSDRNRGTGSCGSIRLDRFFFFFCLLDFLDCDCHCMSFGDNT